MSPQIRSPLPLAFLAAIICFAAFSSQCSPLFSQAEPGKKPEYQGITRCLDCHYAPNPLRSTSFIAMNEGKIWLEEDKHAIAYRQLASALGKRMAAKLGMADPQADRACLSCHANWQSGFDVPPNSHQHGVNCEACHGPSSRWETPHADIAWRKLSPTAKQELGMVDLRSASVRARLCFSCHIGDREQGKFVTHAMYVAGHPPLPSIEVGSFMKQMPSHWRLLPEKSNFQHRDAFVRVNSINDSKVDHLPTIKTVVVSGVVALQESIRLFADQLENEETGRIEFAAFDCSACHHELRTTSWRQVRGRVADRPGRPLPAIWPGTLIPVAIRHVAGDDEQAFRRMNNDFSELQRELLKASASRPFGDREQVRSTAGRILPWLEQLAGKVENRVVRRVDGERILQSMFQIGQAELLDFHAARMLSWAIMTAATELNAPYPILGDDIRGDTYSNWLRDVKLPAERRLFTVWRESGLFTDLSLKLSAGQNETLDDPRAGRLSVAFRYDAIDFRVRLIKLAKQFETRPLDAEVPR